MMIRSFTFQWPFPAGHLCDIVEGGKRYRYYGFQWPFPAGHLCDRKTPTASSP